MKSMHTVDNYKIGTAAKYLGVSVDTLRRWEKAGKISVVKTSAGTRFYSKAELDKIRGRASKEDSLMISEAAKRIGVSVKTLRRWDKSERLVALRDGDGHRIYDPRFLFKPHLLSRGYFLTRHQSLTSLAVIGLAVFGVMLTSALGTKLAPFSSKETTVKTEDLVMSRSSLAKLNPSSYIYNVGKTEVPPVPSSQISLFNKQIEPHFQIISRDLFFTIKSAPKVSNTNIDYLNGSSSENLQVAK